MVDRFQKASITNIKCVESENMDPKIPEKCDVIFTCNTYHHFSDRVKYFENLKQYLKPNGMLVIVDFKKEEFPVKMGPPLHIKIERSQILEELSNAGFKALDITFPTTYHNNLFFSAL